MMELKYFTTTPLYKMAEYVRYLDDDRNVIEVPTEEQEIIKFLDRKVITHRLYVEDDTAYLDIILK